MKSKPGVPAVAEVAIAAGMFPVRTRPLAPLASYHFFCWYFVRTNSRIRCESSSSVGKAKSDGFHLAIHWRRQISLPPSCRHLISSCVKDDAEMDLTRWLNSRLFFFVHGIIQTFIAPYSKYYLQQPRTSSAHKRVVEQIRIRQLLWMRQGERDEGSAVKGRYPRRASLTLDGHSIHFRFSASLRSCRRIFRFFSSCFLLLVLLLLLLLLLLMLLDGWDTTGREKRSINSSQNFV